MLVLNDMLTLAFASPYRILNKKTNESLKYDQPAAASKKTGTQTDPGKDNKLFRLELRANEFRDYPTFRMLTEVQRLGAMFIAYMKSADGLALTEQEEALAELWTHFRQEAKLYREKIGYPADAAYREKHTQSAAEMAGDKEIKSSCRHMITRYSLEVAKLLNQQE